MIQKFIWAAPGEDVSGEVRMPIPFARGFKSR